MLRKISKYMKRTEHGHMLDERNELLVKLLHVNRKSRQIHFHPKYWID